jgi:hypothetical protein
MVVVIRNMVVKSGTWQPPPLNWRTAGIHLYFFSCVAQDENGKCVLSNMQGPTKYIGVGTMMGNGNGTDTSSTAIGMSKVFSHPVLDPLFNMILTMLQKSLLTNHLCSE